MAARGSGMSRAAMAAKAGIAQPRVVSPETRLKISLALHAYHGTQPGEKRKRKYVPHPRVVDPYAAARNRGRKPPSLSAQVRAKNKRLHTPTRTIPGRKLRAESLLVPVTHRRRMTRTAHLISAHHHRRRIGLVHIHRTGRRNRSLIFIRVPRNAHRVWHLKLKLVGGRRV